jgi:hypothetical protein
VNKAVENRLEKLERALGVVTEEQERDCYHSQSAEDHEASHQ